MECLPDAGRLPVAQPAPASWATAAAELLRQQAPGRTGAEDEDDAAEYGAIGDAGAAALGVGRALRQEGLDRLPEIIGDAGLTHNEGALSGPPGF